MKILLALECYQFPAIIDNGILKKKMHQNYTLLVIRNQFIFRIAHMKSENNSYEAPRLNLQPLYCA